MGLRTVSIDRALPAALALALVATPAGAAVTSISSSAYVLGIDLTIAGISVSPGPVIPAYGSSPPVYNVQNSVASFNIPGLIDSGVAGASAFSLLPPTPSGGASALITDFSLFIGPLLDISGTEVGSSSSVSGTGTPTASASTTIDNLAISGLVIGSTPITVTGSPAPNTVILDNSTIGLEIVLNQQTPDLSETAGITTDAISIIFSNFPYGLGVVNGDIDIAGSSASIVATPEPATWAEMLAGFAVLGFLMRGRRKAEAVA